MWNGKWSEVEKNNIPIWSGSIRVFVLHEKSFHKPYAKHILEVTADEVQKSTHIHSYSLSTTLMNDNVNNGTQACGRWIQIDSIIFKTTKMLA